MKLPWNFSRPGSAWVMGKEGIYVERGVDEPRYQWTPEGKSEGLLVEPQSTNYVRPTQGFSPGKNNVYGLIWGMTSATSLVWDGEVAQVIGDGTGGVRVHFGYDSSEFNNASALWSSVEVKAGTYEYVRLSTTIAANASNAVRLNLSTGEVTLRGTPLYKVIPLNDGWYRIGIARSSSNFYLSCFALYLTSYISGNDAGWNNPGNFPAEGQYIYMRRPQVELIPSMTSFIPTSGVAVTRPADTLYADMSLVEGFDPTQGTIVVEWVDLSPAGQPLQIGSSTALVPSDYIRISRSTDATGVQLVCKASGIASEATPFAVVSPVNQINRAAFRWSASDRMAIAVNGEIRIRDDLLTAVPTGLRYLRVGQEAHGLYRRVQYIPQAVSDAQLQQLSSLP